jgi:hypothetical protein
MQPVLLSDRYLHQHVAYIIREYRVLAYCQFLEAYKRLVRREFVCIVKISQYQDR